MKEKSVANIEVVATNKTSKVNGYLMTYAIFFLGLVFVVFVFSLMSVPKHRDGTTPDASGVQTSTNRNSATPAPAPTPAGSSR